MKKVLALLLAALMVFSLAACTSGGDSKTSTEAAKTTEATEAAKTTEAAKDDAETKETAAPAGEPYKVRFILSYILTPPGEEAVKDVENCINKYMKEDLGITEFELQLEVMGASDANTQVPLLLAGGEKIDIISISNFSTDVNNGYLLSLDDYLDNELKGAVEKVSASLPCYYLQGHQYGIASWSSLIASYRWLYNKDMVESAGVDTSNLDDFQDIIDCLKKLKEAYPNEHFICNTNLFPAIYAKEVHLNAIGRFAGTIGDDTTLVNYFATDAFKTACEKAYEVHNAGLDDPEGSNQTTGVDQLTYSGSSKGVIMGYPATMDTFVAIFNNNNTYGATFAAVDMFDTDMPNTWYGYGIPYTSENPSAAAKMLNLIWTDEFIFNTLGYGIEGEDYVWLDKENKVVAYPDGMTQLNVHYNCYYKMAGMGDVRMQWELRPGGTSKADLEYYQMQVENSYYPPAYGFTPDSGPVQTQVAAATNVYDQYYNALTYGEVDPEEYLPKFLQELEDAGVNDIIAEYQKQFDAWRQ